MTNSIKINKSGSPKQAPVFIQAGLFPIMMMGSLYAGWLMLQSGIDERMMVTVITFSGFALMTLFQYLWPHAPSWNSNQHGDLQVDAGYFVANGALMNVIEPIILAACLSVAILIGEQYSADGSLWPNQWHWTAQLFLAVLLGEFVEYWWHRAMHEVPFLWRFHAVHHSAPRLYWLNAVRFHPVDFIISAVGRIIPPALLGCSGDIMALSLIFSSVHGIFQHGNLQIKVGFLNWIFSMAELHRWHHSKTVEESNNNYGGNFIFWDIVFGTRFLPKDREPPQEIGIADMPNFPMKFWDQLKSPFRWEKVLKESR